MNNNIINIDDLENKIAENVGAITQMEAAVSVYNACEMKISSIIAEIRGYSNDIKNEKDTYKIIELADKISKLNVDLKNLEVELDKSLATIKNGAMANKIENVKEVVKAAEEKIEVKEDKKVVKPTASTRKEYLNSLNIQELRAMCKKNGLKGYTRKSKADLIDFIIEKSDNKNSRIFKPTAKAQTKAEPKEEKPENKISESTNTEEIVKAVQKLNPNADIKLDADTNRVTSSIPAEDLTLPEGFYYNDKNGITNKHNTESGMYAAIEVEPLTKENEVVENVIPEAKEEVNEVQAVKPEYNSQEEFLNSKTDAELQEICEKYNLDGYQNLGRAELISFIIDKSKSRNGHVFTAVTPTEKAPEEKEPEEKVAEEVKEETVVEAPKEEAPKINEVEERAKHIFNAVPNENANASVIEDDKPLFQNIDQYDDELNQMQADIIKNSSRKDLQKMGYDTYKVEKHKIVKIEKANPVVATSIFNKLKSGTAKIKPFMQKVKEDLMAQAEKLKKIKDTNQITAEREQFLRENDGYNVSMTNEWIDGVPVFNEDVNENKGMAM